MTAAGCTYKSVKPLPPKEPGNYHADSPTLTTKVKWAPTRRRPAATTRSGRSGASTARP